MAIQRLTLIVAMLGIHRNGFDIVLLQALDHVGDEGRPDAVPLHRRMHSQSRQMANTPVTGADLETHHAIISEGNHILRSLSSRLMNIRGAHLPGGRESGIIDADNLRQMFRIGRLNHKRRVGFWQRHVGLFTAVKRDNIFFVAKTQLRQQPLL